MHDIDPAKLKKRKTVVTPLVGLLHSLHPLTVFASQGTKQESDVLEYAFDLLEVGCTGTIEVIPESINKSSNEELKLLTTVSSY